MWSGKKVGFRAKQGLQSNSDSINIHVLSKFLTWAYFLICEMGIMQSLHECCKDKSTDVKNLAYHRYFIKVSFYFLSWSFQLQDLKQLENSYFWIFHSQLNSSVIELTGYMQIEMLALKSLRARIKTYIKNRHVFSGTCHTIGPW